MGYYSFTCAKTGLPVASGDCGCEPKFYRVVVLDRNGSVIKGDYDGYGRVGDYDDAAEGVGERSGPKMVLAHFYRNESFEQLGVSGHDPDQGAYDPGFWPAMYQAKEESVDFDGRQYPKRLAERTRLRGQMNQFMDVQQGVTTSQLYNLAHILDRFDVEEPVRAAAQLDEAWRKVLAGFPNGVIPQGHLAHGMTPAEASAALDGQRGMLTALITQEVMCAWVESRPAHEPDFEALLRGDIDAGWRAPAATSVAEASRMRP